MITEIEDFFAHGCGRCERFDTPECSALRWASGLAALRRICLDTGMSEAVKWGHPCYAHAGRNVVLIGALRGEFRLNFFHAALLSDPEGVLEKQGPNTQNPDSMKFTSLEDVTRLEGTLRAMLREAMDHAEAGRLPPKVETELELPEELEEALGADPELAVAFQALTPGRQRSYVILLSGAKSSDTRRRRIEKARPKILEGKGAQER
ncbi:MAG: YdeI/OmpD-associated family protein [Alphaproteobacteria bacterium]|nr:YdeI/OmpD-associated family protein [Myxococcales bacterium]MCB9686476.1 YdeI/OmpD-associated family protein [Alphaproteobacteria bacterium]MCB9696852.1 YdeI/OmpD-associated family protein [Alphaproteobacteria bacterium]